MEQQHSRRSKISHKEFYRWMTFEIEDFIPETTPENSFKKFDYLLKTNPPTSLPIPERKKLVVKPFKPVIPLELGSNSSLCNYWEQFPRKLNEKMILFLDVKDIIMLMSTCKYFKETLDQGSTWKILQNREGFDRLIKLRDDSKDRVSEKLYYKYLYFSKISGIPYHSGYFKAYGSPDVVELSDSIVDFLCPKNEMIKKYANKILMRNQCKTVDLKLSWLKEKNEICLWNGNSSIEFKKPYAGNEKFETINRFYPCFIKKYSMVNEDEEIVKAFFLEDKYLVIKLQLKEEEKVVFRMLDLEEELCSIAKGLDSVIPFDYSFMMNEGQDLVDIKTSEFEVDFVLNQEAKCDLKVKLLLGDKVVFYTENLVTPTMIFWDLKEKKKISVVNLDLEKPLNTIMISKKSATETDKIKLILLDEDMNVYCGALSEKDGFILNNRIIIPISVEEKEEEIEKPQKENDIEKEKELEARSFLNLGKKTRSKHTRHPYHAHMFEAPPYYSTKQLDPQFSKENRRYYHEIWNKTNEEWLIVHAKNNFHFINLDEEKIHEFSSDKDIGLLSSGNWAIYEDNLLITNPTNIFYYRINFEDHSIRFVFSREFKHLSVGEIAQQWIVLDPYFTVLIFTHIYRLGFTTKVTIVVTSTQEFLYNQDRAFNLISYQVQTEQFISPPDRWEPKDRAVNIKFENSKVLVSTEKASFYFDMMLSVQPYNKANRNGWFSKDPIDTIRYNKLVNIEAENETEGEKIKLPKQKMANYMKLERSKNNVNVIEKKNNEWKKDGKSEERKEGEKKSRVVKSKEDKYHKNIRQSQRSEKMNEI